ncbi:MAG: T9SS type A sorting domain-containing protein, partial [Candidatus Cloacimonadota bacterium]|nr:T9SS type A sorting domain-containing protein [Candidatus Cloacimonadota bacterium]
PMTLQPDEEELVHIEIHVNSADTFQIYFLVNEAESEAVTYTFNFTSELTENSSNSVEVEQLNLTAYPNPFNPKTSINFNLQKNENIKIDIYNVLGKKVETLVDNNFERGSHIVDWNANELPSGIYFFKLVTSQSTATKRITLLK